MTHGPTNTRVLRSLKSSLYLSQEQKELVLGTILGDGCLITSRSGRSARLQIRHKVKHQEYVEWKYQFFNKWVTTPPRFDRFNNSWYFRTVSHSSLMEIKNLFYKGSQRFVPENIANILESPFSLAVWLMDDGNGKPPSAAFRISSYGFGLEGNILLKQCLENNFSLASNIHRDAKGYFLYIPVSYGRQLYKLVEPYIVPCMRYKFATLTP